MNKSKLMVLALLVTITMTVSNAQTDRKAGGAPEQEGITLINPFIVPAGKLSETILMWEQARDFLQQQPGYISTALHQSVTPEAQYRLINVARWRSAEAYKTATRKMREEANLPAIEGVRPAPQLYTVIRN